MEKKSTILRLRKTTTPQPRNFVIQRILEYSKSTRILFVQGEMLSFALS